MMRMLVALGLLTVGGGNLVGQAAVQYEHFTLDNGLSVYLVPDRTVPVVTVNVWYNVGSRNERPGRSGFAHLFEHMMFQGSANVGKGEHFQLIERAGGNLNGTTNTDRTNYFEILPSHRLNLGLWLEADRMRSLAITDENFENQRETVKEERRLRVDNQPYAAAFTEGLATGFDSTSCFGYSHTVIGSMDDLSAATSPDVQDFFNLYYAPNNATLTIVGDFAPDEAKRLVRGYFGDIPRGAEPPGITCEARFGAAGEETVWEDQLANLPAVLIAYLVPEHKDADSPALSLLQTILGDGESSRLNLALVRDQQVALQSGAFLDSRRGPGQLIGFAIANQGQTADTLAAALRAAIAEVAANGITPAELTKAKNAFRRNFVFGRQSSMGIAENVQHYVHFHDDVSEINTDLDRYLAVTAADIQRVAQRYLVPANSTTIIVVPKGQGVQP
ncbi:MAG: insulinase family protein [Gemmatimonadota bacterium]|nr:insulinase family protein [Gemmatimonadota bacterium]